MISTCPGALYILKISNQSIWVSCCIFHMHLGQAGYATDLSVLNWVITNWIITTRIPITTYLKPRTNKKGIVCNL